MKTITLSILRSVIIDAVKIDTYIRGTIDKASDERANRMAYHETAGDEDAHERKLQATMVSAAESLATYLSDYLLPSNQLTGDNAVILDYSGNSEIVFTLNVSDRFNETYTSSLARLASKFISTSMLVEWYETINPNQAEVYSRKIPSIKADIQRCFNKTAPQQPYYPFTQELTLDKDEVTILMPDNYFKTEHTMEQLIGYEAVVNYTIDENTIDDIEFKTDIRKFAIVNKAKFGAINIIPKGIGVGYLTVWSRHMEADTKKTIKIEVKYESNE